MKNWGTAGGLDIRQHRMLATSPAVLITATWISEGDNCYMLYRGAGGGGLTMQHSTEACACVPGSGLATRIQGIDKQL